MFKKCCKYHSHAASEEQSLSLSLVAFAERNKYLLHYRVLRFFERKSSRNAFLSFSEQQEKYEETEGEGEQVGNEVTGEEEMAMKTENDVFEGMDEAEMPREKELVGEKPLELVFPPLPVVSWITPPEIPSETIGTGLNKKVTRLRLPRPIRQRLGVSVDT